MNPDTREIKVGLRREVLRRRESLSGEEAAARSRAVTARLVTLPEYLAAGTIMVYCSYKREVGTADLIAESIARGKVVAVPKTVPAERRMIPSRVVEPGDDLAPGNFGIPEPRAERFRRVDPRAIDLVVVPGVVFDRRGNRLGYGGGYYDRFLKGLRPGGTVVAVAFELQLVESLSPGRFDVPVDLIVTEERVIDCRANRRPRPADGGPAGGPR